MSIVYDSYYRYIKTFAKIPLIFTSTYLRHLEANINADQVLNLQQNNFWLPLYNMYFNNQLCIDYNKYLIDNFLFIDFSDCSIISILF